MELLRTQGLTTYERQLLLRVKTGKLSLWNTQDDNNRRPHVGCVVTERATALHTFWTCPHARQLWGEIKRRWIGVGVVGNAITALATFSLLTPVEPTRLWYKVTAAHPGLADDDDTQDQLHVAAAVVWGYMYGAAVARIWRHRLAALACEESGQTGFVNSSAARLRGGVAIVAR